MRTPKPLPEGSNEKLAMALKLAKTKGEFQRVQCLWLRASLGLSADKVATAIGWHAGSVRKLQARYLREGEAVPERYRKRWTVLSEPNVRRRTTITTRVSAPGRKGWNPGSEPGQGRL